MKDRPTFKEWIEYQYEGLAFFCGHTYTDMKTAWDEQERYLKMVEEERDRYKAKYETLIRKGTGDDK